MSFREELPTDYSDEPNIAVPTRDTWEIRSNVIGELIEETSLCIPVSGTISRTHGTNRNDFPFSATTTTVSKEVGDQYWKVMFTDSDSETHESLARELVLANYGADDKILPTFKCDRVDF